MNRLHVLLERLRKGRLRVSGGLGHGDIVADSLRRILRLAESAVCFDFGEASALANISPAGFVRLPYPTIWAEFYPVVKDDEDLPSAETRWRAGVLAHESDDGLVIEAFAFFLLNGEWVMLSTSRLTRSGLGKDDWESVEWRPETTAGEYPMGVVLRACAVMKCTNVQLLENKPSALKRMRAAKKRLPIFSTWTLHMRPDAKQGRALGGTHAPPRVHLRRGHIRQYRSGLTTWVQPCVVGRKDLGVVHKDYAMHAARTGT
jgi:hypothetical protein